MVGGPTKIEAILFVRESPEGEPEVEFYASIDELACAIEAPDVADGMYRAFDSTGVQFVLHGNQKSRFLWFEIPNYALVRAEPATFDPGGLQAHLRAALTRAGRLAALDALSLDDLIERARLISLRP